MTDPRSKGEEMTPDFEPFAEIYRWSRSMVQGLQLSVATLSAEREQQEAIIKRLHAQCARIEDGVCLYSGVPGLYECRLENPCIVCRNRAEVERLRSRISRLEADSPGERDAAATYGMRLERAACAELLEEMARRASGRGCSAQGIVDLCQYAADSIRARAGK